jgi:hypothetical protein
MVIVRHWLRFRFRKQPVLILRQDVVHDAINEIVLVSQVAPPVSDKVFKRDFEIRIGQGGIELSGGSQELAELAGIVLGIEPVRPDALLIGL